MSEDDGRVFDLLRPFPHSGVAGLAELRHGGAGAGNRQVGRSRTCVTRGERRQQEGGLQA